MKLEKAAAKEFFTIHDQSFGLHCRLQQCCYAHHDSSHFGAKPLTHDNAVTMVGDAIV